MNSQSEAGSSSPAEASLRSRVARRSAGGAVDGEAPAVGVDGVRIVRPAVVAGAGIAGGSIRRRGFGWGAGSVCVALDDDEAVMPPRQVLRSSSSGPSECSDVIGPADAVEAQPQSRVASVNARRKNRTA